MGVGNVGSCRLLGSLLQPGVDALCVLHFARCSAVVCFTFVAFNFCLFLLVSSVTRPVCLPVDEYCLRVVIVSGTLTQLASQPALWLAWFKPKARVPYYPAHWSMTRIASLLEEHPILNDGLVTILIAALLACLIDAFYVLFAILLLSVLCVADAWRGLLNHYSMCGLILVWFLQGDIEALNACLSVMLGGLYFWSGLFKLCSPGFSFFRDVAPVVFAPIFDITRSLSRLVIPSRHERSVDMLCLVLSGLGVAAEALLGLVFLFLAYCSCGTSLSLPFWTRQVVAVFHLSMHCYIVLVLGLIGVDEGTGNRRRRFFIVAWNAMCAALGQLMLLAVPWESGSTEHASQPPLLYQSYWRLASLLVVFAIMVVLPALTFVGLCPSAYLAHAYFAPGWFGSDWLLLPAVVATSVPEPAKTPVRPTEFAQLLAEVPRVREACSIVAAQVLHLGLARGAEVCRDNVHSLAWVAIDSTWVEASQELETHLFGQRHSSWNGRLVIASERYWAHFVSRAFSHPVVYVSTDEWTVWGRRNRCCVLGMHT
eukprot:TRINITY_DN43040_c0_g1_i1.p1 TRINITY_DN43040_c0_g1~~TRINITY_DN43040_c0_g1_i1.p1  ORF type:complete len:539 (-),score=34.99 TRINITY_DN43040_c0_g1_i1:40-1656(-)